MSPSENKKPLFKIHNAVYKAKSTLSDFRAQTLDHNSVLP